MSLTAFKRKSVINYGSGRSGKPPGGIWLPQGPFGRELVALQLAKENYGSAGFSINGGHRNVGGVGQDMKMSKSGTPYRGTNPIGWGGTNGTYPSAELVGPYGGAISNSSKTAVVQPLLNGRFAAVANQYMYIKPSVLSTKGMLEKKYKWIHNGQYPNYWVQPNYTGNQTDSASQMLYIQNKAAANVCKVNVNNVGTYFGNIKQTGPTLCTPGRSTAMFTYNSMSSNAPYTKTLYQPVSYTQYNQYITRGCNDPIGKQKPFPYATTSGSSHSASGTSITSFGSGCNSSPVYLAPPEWYNAIQPSQVPNTNVQTQVLPFLLNNIKN